MQIFRRIRNAFGLLAHGWERIDSLSDSLSHTREALARSEARVDALSRRADAAESALKSLQSADPAFINAFARRLESCPEPVELINRTLSTRRTLWGSPDRLHISPRADVFTCFFNTNSGSVTVGDYTFAGSGVSLLAGSHDPALTGLLRRDAEYTEGCDIVVGRGVWLASGCMLLGPCTVGDNAVIAAGAVVTPGTNVPANTIYGGIPAREISRLEPPPADPAADPAVLRALGRRGGVLYAKGFSSRKDGVASFYGYWLEDPEGQLLVNRSRWNLRFFLDGASRATVVFSGSRGQLEYALSDQQGDIPISLPCEEGAAEQVTVRLSAEAGRLFMVLE